MTDDEIDQLLPPPSYSAVRVLRGLRISVPVSLNVSYSAVGKSLRSPLFKPPRHSESRSRHAIRRVEGGLREVFFKRRVV